MFLLAGLFALAITGNVIRLDGAPVAGAQLTATRPGGKLLTSAVSDANGAFKLDVDGVVDVVAQAEGFRREEQKFLAGEQPITIVLHEGRAVPLPPPPQTEHEGPAEERDKTISGTVRDEANHPIVGAALSIDGIAPVPPAITDAKGQFTVSVPD